MTTEAVLGASIKRREDPRLITGKGTYVDDVRMVGTLNMVLVRSPHAHANIIGVHTSGARPPMVWSPSIPAPTLRSS